MKRLVTKYRLVFLNETSINGSFTLTLTDPSGSNYGPDYRDEQEFDTMEEALTHAQNSEKWQHSQFTVLPVYNITGF